MVARRIAERYPLLSPALRKFADHVIAEPLDLARMSIYAAVKEVGVSVATANRFATAIGFSGYAEFRGELIKGFESLFAPAERLKQKLAEGASPQEVMVASLREDIANLEATIANLSTYQTDMAVRMIVDAERIYVAGFENAGSLANILAAGLELTGKSVRVAENGGGVVGAARQLFKLGDRDLVIAIAFSFYLRDTLIVTQHAKRHGVPVLAITDRLTSPLVAMSELAFLVEAHHEFNPPSETVILGLIEALVAAVASKSPNAADVFERFAAYTCRWMISSPDQWTF